MAIWRRYFAYHSGDQENIPIKKVHQNYVSLEGILIYCLDILKIKDNESEIRRNTLEYFKKVPVESVKSYNNEWFAATKIIADTYAIYNQSCNDGDHMFFSQSQVCDFFTLATKGIGEKEISTRKRDIIFNIFRDIIQNYQNFDFILKSNYPQIIIDVMLILHRGTDSACKMISLLDIDEYYKLRKLRASEETLAAKAVDMHTTTTITSQAERLKKDRNIQEQLIQFLIQITGRRSKELEKSLSILHSSETKKISDLCANYNKVEKYCKLIGSKEEFRNELEREINRKLTDNQVQIDALSIRKVRKYIENLLDGGFIPHDTHGINHIKHNLEYGYQVMDLIERKGKGNFSSH